MFLGWKKYTNNGVNKYPTNPLTVFKIKLSTSNKRKALGYIQKIPVNWVISKNKDNKNIAKIV